jgi:MFS family permease
MIPNESDKLLPLRSVLTKPVVIAVANYSMLSLLDSVLESYIPLVWSTPVEYGGLNLSPASIGMWLSLYGGMDGIFQFVFFPHFISRFGQRRVFVFSIVSSAVILAIFPFENLAMAAGGGPNLVVWLLIILQMSALCIFDMGYGKFLRRIPQLMQMSLLMVHVGSLRCSVHVHFICRAQQTVARRRVWPFAGGVRDSECCRTGYCGPAICVLPDV